MQLSGVSGRLEAFAQLVTLLIIFIFVLGITYFATRWVGNFQKNKLAGSNIKILETMRISNNKYIQIVKIGCKCFAVAIGKDTITYLCEVNEDELIYQETSTQIKSESFRAVLDKFRKDKPED